MLRRLASWADRIDRLSEATGRALSLLMPVLVGVIVVEVAARYFLSAPTIWAYDSALLLYAWIGLVGGASALRRDGHIRVDIVITRLPPKGRAVLELVTLPLVAFFVVLVLWQVGLATLEAFESGSRRPTEWAPPLMLFLGTAPLGAALVLVQLLSQAVRAALVLAGDEGGGS